MGLPVAILVPVLNRPHRVEPLLDSIARATPNPHVVLFICDPGDRAEQDAIAAAGGWMISPGGNYASKINAGIRATSEPLIFTGADDLDFHPGWLKHASALMSDTIGVVGTNDLCNPRVIDGEHSTHSLVARWYAQLGTIDEPDSGKLLHEGYPHEFVDDELIATAKHRGAYAHAHRAVVEHLHPDAGKAPTDALYEGRRRRMRRGRVIFHERSALWT
jgi:glycosyltransferase involved in cell wall biosynthesis